MKTKPDNETVHIKADDILPIDSFSTLETKILKRILEQMVENERQRVRNELFRIILAILVVLLLLLGGGFWLSRDILRQIKDERQTAEHSWNEMIQRVPTRLDDTMLVAQSLEPASPQASGDSLLTEAGGANLKPGQEPTPYYSSCLTIPVQGQIPLRAPIPEP